MIRGRRPNVVPNNSGFVNRHGEPAEPQHCPPFLCLAARFALRGAVFGGGLLSALPAGLAQLAAPRCRPDRRPARRPAVHPHPVHAGHQLCRRPAGRPPQDPDRARLGIADLISAAVGCGRLLHHAACHDAARDQLDHDHAADRDGGGERHPFPRARLWTGAAVGVDQFHRGEPGRGVRHRARGSGGGDAAAGRGDRRW